MILSSTEGRRQMRSPIRILFSCLLLVVAISAVPWISGPSAAYAVTCVNKVTWSASTPKSFAPGGLCIGQTGHIPSKLRFLSNGNLVLYRQNSTGSWYRVWQSHTAGRGLSFRLYKNGNVAVYGCLASTCSTGTGNIWATHTGKGLAPDMYAGIGVGVTVGGHSCWVVGFFVQLIGWTTQWTDESTERCFDTYVNG